jgi:hypothetical protein
MKNTLRSHQTSAKKTHQFKLDLSANTDKYSGEATFSVAIKNASDPFFRKILNMLFKLKSGVENGN